MEIYGHHWPRKLSWTRLASSVEITTSNLDANESECQEATHTRFVAQLPTTETMSVNWHADEKGLAQCTWPSTSCELS